MSRVIDFILPHRCTLCSELTSQSNGLCSICFSQLHFISKPYCNSCGAPFEFKVDGVNECGKCISTPPPYILSRSLLKFDMYSKKLIHSFKYNDKTSNAKFFSKLLFSRYQEDFKDIDIIVPVPMNRFKRIFRYYNPPQILGEHLSRLLAVKHIPDLLIKSKWTKAQASLSKVQRQKNLKGSLYVNKGYFINNKVVLLIDDVKTTGATASICSSILLNSGASKVKLITIAMT